MPCVLAFVVRAFRQLVIQFFDAFLHFADVFESLFSFFHHRMFIAQHHNLRQVTQCNVICTATVPEVGDCCPAKILSKVDLPAPFFPTSAMRSFLLMTKETSEKSGRALNSTERCSTDIIGFVEEWGMG